MVTFPGGYEVTERTRFKVRIAIHQTVDLEPKVDWIYGLTSPEEVQHAYMDARDASGLGAAQFGGGEVIDEMGQHVANVSYNGRLWPAEPWRPGLVFLADIPQRPRADANDPEPF
ncbi:hypothetical protein ACEUZ9_001140 [Paracoccus litorisediminis]|uniref:hypothetical protein n=1 Tax=Paracoccus litorisediminis TaxID=2006130 RepID=UPI00372EEBDB